MIPLVVIDAEVAPTDNSVLGSLPNLMPATALIPAWAPMVGLAATLGTMVMPDLLCKVSAFLPGWSIFLAKSPKSYCLFRLYYGLWILYFLIRNESALSESTGGATWP